MQNHHVVDLTVCVSINGIMHLEEFCISPGFILELKGGKKFIGVSRKLCLLEENERKIKLYLFVLFVFYRTFASIVH